MKQYKVLYILVAILFVSVSLHGNLCDDPCKDECKTTDCLSCSLGQNLWQPHVFSVSMSREILIEKGFWYREHDADEKVLKCFGVGFEYMQNWGEKCCVTSTDSSKSCCKSLGSLPFWSGTNELTVGDNGLDAAGAVSTLAADLDAYQFGLGEVSNKGLIRLCPKVFQAGVDLLWYRQCKRFWGKLKVPVGAMSVEHRLEEPTVATPKGENDTWTMYPVPADRYKNMSAAFYGGDVTDSTIVDGNIFRGIALEKGRMSPCRLVAIRAADITGSVGCNVIDEHRGHLGVGFRASAPTGNVPQGTYMLEPLFGRAGHWGIGAEVLGSYRALDDFNDWYVDVWFNAEIMHLRSGRKPSFRSFDLKKNGPGSKYLLVQFYHSGDTPSYILQAVNITTLPVWSRISVEGNGAFLFDFHKDNCSFGIGMEFWGRSRECLCIDTCRATQLQIPDLNRFAVLGRQIDHYGGGAGTALYLCEPEAKINKSQTRLTTLPGTLPTGIADARQDVNRIPSSVTEALDIDAARAASIFSGKLFFSAGYLWSDCYVCLPAFSVSGAVEFSNCGKSAVRFWSLGLQANIDF